MSSFVSDVLGQVHPMLRGLSGIPLGVFVLVLVLTSIFTLGYSVQAVRVWWQLRVVLRGLAELKRDGAGVSVNPKNADAAMNRGPFHHLWQEYKDSLHELRKTGNPERPISEWRATMPAESFFARDVLVDNRLFDDFTRHLPGILTGLGIIGTFAGLLDGLSRFDATSSATAVAGLKPLLDGVAHAFTASAMAIGCAMAITFGSRFVSALLYGRVQKLNHEIDALYATGAGEEYLSRLVRASEKSEAHTAQLKQALMDELRTILTNLTERQIAAQAESHRALGAHFSQSIRTSLEEPLRDMTKAMQSVNQGAGEAAGTMLQSLLTGFMAKLEETFGGQMRGINEQMERSIAAMSTVQVALHKLVEDIGHSNERSSGAMRDTLEQTVGKVMGQLTLALDHMEATRIAATAQEQSRNEQLTSAAAQLVASLSTQVDGLVRSVGAVGTSSLVAMDGMTAGAREISEAAARIAAAGNAVSSLFDKTAVAGERLAATANALQTTSQAVRQGFEQYDRTRQTVDAHVTVLTELIATAHRDAGLSRQMLQELERLVGQIRVATHESEEYLKGINASLTTAFESFGNSLVGVIQKTSGETDKHLSNGMQHLIGVVQELAVALSRVKKM